MAGPIPGIGEFARSASVHIVEVGSDLANALLAIRLVFLNGR
jgi:hypothetical protein